MTTIETLTQVFSAGYEAARLADPGMLHDGGTCNLDKIAIYLPRLRTSTINDAAQRANVSAHKFSGWGPGWYWVGVCANGQGNRRTVMVEAAAEVMRSKLQELQCTKWDVQVYYQMD